MEDKYFYVGTDIEVSPDIIEYYKQYATNYLKKTENDGTSKHQKHYQVGSKQPIEVMQEVMSKEEFEGYCRGNIIKYAMRMKHKDEAVKEVGKIKQYAEWLHLSLQGQKIKP